MNGMRRKRSDPSVRKKKVNAPFIVELTDCAWCFVRVLSSELLAATRNLWFHVCFFVCCAAVDMVCGHRVFVAVDTHGKSRPGKFRRVVGGHLSRGGRCGDYWLSVQAVRTIL